MKVSHASTEVQTASLGISNVAEEVTVSTDAEFMMMIAHGIYSDKPLALVRELLCNARDGHAKAGKLDSFIDVTLTDNSLVVRDYGTGIPNDKFTSIYMTFGQSTKKDDPNSTGGFGVGTKVPYAVCDSFSARNFIDGMMTAYSIVKSDPNMKGKPSCVAVVQVPSKEPSGVEVTVPFPEKLRPSIEQRIIEFANELVIPIRLNGADLSGYEFYDVNELKTNKYVTVRKYPSTTVKANLPYFVRLGDVIYPVEEHEEYAEALTLLSSISNHCYIMYAEPGSAAPTLSRESLQLTNQTVATIKSLFKKILQDVADKIDDYALGFEQFLKSYIQNSPDFALKYWSKEYKHSDVLDNYVPVIPTISQDQLDVLKSNLGRWIRMQVPYLKSKTIVSRDYVQKLTAIVQSRFSALISSSYYLNHEIVSDMVVVGDSMYGWGSPHLPTTLRQKVDRIVLEEYDYFKYLIRGTEFISDVTTVAYNKVKNSFASPDQDFSSFREYIKQEERNPENFGPKSYNGRTNPVDLRVGMSLAMSKAVVISHSVHALIVRFDEKFAGNTIENRNIFGHRHAMLVGARCIRVKLNTKPEQIKELKEHFESIGYFVYDLTEFSQVEQQRKALEALDKIDKEAVKQPTLGDLFLEKNEGRSAKKKTALRKLRGINASPALVGRPLYYLAPRGKELPWGLNDISHYLALVSVVGTDIFAVSTKPEIAKAIKEKRISVEDELLNFAKWLYRQQDVREYLFYRDTLFSAWTKKNKYLTKYLFNRVAPTLSPEKMKMLEALQIVRNGFAELSKYIEARENFYRTACSADKHYRKVLHDYAELHFCDVDRALAYAFKPKPSQQRAIARSILKTILKEKPV